MGIIGGGAAGLATARTFLRANEEEGSIRFVVTVLEARDCIGGIWNYHNNNINPASTSTNTNNKKCRPMYQNLRTNLPRELMAFQELPWGGDGMNSYVSHLEVQQYLEEYANKFDLMRLIHFGCSVTALKMLIGDDKAECNNEKKWSKISLEWMDRNKNQSSQQMFDAVCICTGHYALPSYPRIPGLDNFSGKVMHSIEYDNPSDFVGLTVLCVGGRASGGDITREISQVAKRVYLSDSSCDRKQEYGNVVHMPRTRSITGYGGFTFSNEKNDIWTTNDVDVIILCSGYDYSFPFITNKSNLDFTAPIGERRVQPLYLQLWHAHHPSLSFIGLPHSVVPFPFCEIQANAVVSQWTGKVGSIPLPQLTDRIAAAERDANSGGPKGLRIVDTHELGSAQWNYCTRLAKISGTYDESMSCFIDTNRAIYEKSREERTRTLPGGNDLYRNTRFCRCDKDRSFEIL